MVTHETRIREVPGSNPGATNLAGVFSWFSSIIKANAGLDFHYHDPFVHYSSNSCIIKLKSVNLTNETLRGGDVHFLIATLYTHVHKWLPEINKTMFTPPPRSPQ